VKRLSLSREELRKVSELLDAMPKIEVVLARYAPDLHRVLFGAESPGSSVHVEATSRKVFLASAEPSGAHTDGKGHYVFEDGHRHCSDCRDKLAAAGDPTIGHEREFGDDFRHTMAQRYVLAYPGTSYLAAVEMVDRESAGGVEP
jgi:hypothetical protein